MFNQRQIDNTDVSKLVSANLFIDPLFFFSPSIAQRRNINKKSNVKRLLAQRMCPSSQVTTASFGCLFFFQRSLIRARDGTQQPAIQSCSEI